MDRKHGASNFLGKNERTDMKRKTTALLAAIGIAGLASAGIAQQDFQLRLVASGLASPKGITAASPLLREGLMEQYLFVAESGADRVLKISTDGAIVTAFTQPMRSFPVGLACFGSSFAQDLYVGNATSGGVMRVDAQGSDMPFALHQMSVAGLDFGGCDYGNDLYVGEWLTGKVWRIDPLGNATLFATVPGEARYLKFGTPVFGNKLFVTDYTTGNIYKVDPDGTVMLFASTGASCLEGLDFSTGGVFGQYLYTGNLCSGDIYRVDRTGNVILWMGGVLPGAADIVFTTSGTDMHTMYVVDGKTSVWAFSQY